MHLKYFCYFLKLLSLFLACEVRIDKFDTVSTGRPKLNLAIACLKDDALEEVVFHAAQTEIDTIYFLRTDFSQEPKNSDLHKLVRRAELKPKISSASRLNCPNSSIDTTPEKASNNTMQLKPAMLFLRKPFILFFDISLH